MRTIVDLPDEQLSELAKVCSAKSISRAEAVRRAVELFLKDSIKPAPDAGFGAWKHKKLNSRKFINDIRDEWSAK